MFRSNRIHPSLCTADIHRISFSAGIIRVRHCEALLRITCDCNRIAVDRALTYSIDILLPIFVVFTQTGKGSLPVVAGIQSKSFICFLPIPSERYSYRIGKRIVFINALPNLLYGNINLRRLIGNHILLAGILFHAFHCDIAIGNSYLIGLFRELISFRSRCFFQSIYAGRDVLEGYGTARLRLSFHRNRLAASGGCAFQGEFSPRKGFASVFSIRLRKGEISPESLYIGNFEVHCAEARIHYFPVFHEHIGQVRPAVGQIPTIFQGTFRSSIQCNPIRKRIRIRFVLIVPCDFGSVCLHIPFDGLCVRIVIFHYIVRHSAETIILRIIGSIK